MGAPGKFRQGANATSKNQQQTQNAEHQELAVCSEQEEGVILYDLVPEEGQQDQEPGSSLPVIVGLPAPDWLKRIYKEEDLYDTQRDTSSRQLTKVNSEEDTAHSKRRNQAEGYGKQERKGKQKCRILPAKLP